MPPVNTIKEWAFLDPIPDPLPLNSSPGDFPKVLIIGLYFTKSGDKTYVGFTWNACPTKYQKFHGHLFQHGGEMPKKKESKNTAIAKYFSSDHEFSDDSEDDEATASLFQNILSKIASIDFNSDRIILLKSNGSPNLESNFEDTTLFANLLFQEAYMKPEWCALAAKMSIVHVFGNHDSVKDVAKMTKRDFILTSAQMNQSDFLARPSLNGIRCRVTDMAREMSIEIEGDGLSLTNLLYPLIPTPFQAIKRCRFYR